MVYAIFNISFLVGSTASNEIPVVEGGALNNVMISFTACIKKSNLNYVKGYSWGIKLTGLFQIQMGISFPFLRDEYLRRFLLIMITRISLYGE